MKRFPLHGYIGTALLLTAWILNWSLTGLRTHLLFFPLWLGYALMVDALVCSRKGNSMLTRNLKKFLFLFVVSIPGWWLFELLNLRAQNWHYAGREFFSDAEYFLLASLSFSTVIPAVFGTAELIGSFGWIEKFRSLAKIELSGIKVLFSFMLGWIMLALLMLYPSYFFVFVWMSVYFIIEPVNIWLNNNSSFRYYLRGDYRLLVSLWTGCLTCGFFWEFWNYYSYPKWTYTVPFVDFLHIFEMPLIGYLGYLPFSMELIALYYFVAGFMMRKKSDNFIKIVD
jgi:hypothetical protein